MKKSITIKHLSLNHFKGIKRLSIDFDSQTDVYGANGTGKTTIADAVSWLWFGKDSQNRTDFEIKTLDKFGKSNPKTEHEVTAKYMINGEELNIRRVLKENWVKKRGSNETELAGNTTELYWNRVPLTVTEFNKKVDGIIAERVFKMISNPTYFNDDKALADKKNPAWYNRRLILTDLAGGEISDDELALGNPDYEALVAELKKNKTIEEYESQIKASVKKAKDDLKLIPTRIDEVERSKPEAQDFKALEEELSKNQIELVAVNEQIENSSKALDAKLGAQKELRISINNLEGDIKVIENEARREAQQRLTPDTSALDKLVSEKTTKEQELSTYENSLGVLQGKKSSSENEIKSLEVKISAKRTEWETENAKELNFTDNDFHCPTCKREFEAGDVESKKTEMLATFKANKIAKLNEISAQGKSLAIELETNKAAADALATRIENGQKEIDAIKAQIETIKASISSFNSTANSTSPSEQEVYESILALNTTYEAKVKELTALKLQVEETPTVDNSELVAQRNELTVIIDGLKSKLGTKIQIDNANARIEQLKDEERALSQQVADVEKTQFTIENFIKDKIDRLESAINGKFKMVQFKMFETLINGGHVECCKATVNGVPYSDLNTASRINSGLDIISTLSDFYGVSAPIFIDGRESVTDLIDTDSQIISLIVAPYVKNVGVYSDEELASMLKNYHKIKNVASKVEAA